MKKLRRLTMSPSPKFKCDCTINTEFLLVLVFQQSVALSGFIVVVFFIIFISHNKSVDQISTQ
jgi:hypothetical protein